MREILFKGKRKDTGEWVEGGYSYCSNDDTHYITMMGKDHISHVGFHQQVDPDTLCQYTGLTDKNGRKIWENDIVRYNEEDWFPYAVVKYGEYKNNGNMDCYLGFYMDWQNDIYFRVDIGYWVKNRDIEVIGNIFDNPELLKGGAE